MTFQYASVKKEQEKIEHCQELKIKVQKIWNCRRVSIIPIVIVVLGAVKNLKTWFGKIELCGNTALSQKAC